MAEALRRGKVGSEDLEIFKDKVFTQQSLNNYILLFELFEFLWEDMIRNKMSLCQCCITGDVKFLFSRT